MSETARESKQRHRPRVTGEHVRATPWQSWARRALLQNLESLRDGQLVVRDGGREHRFGNPSKNGATGIIEVKHPALYPAAVLGGSVGAGRAYMDGYWDSPDLTTVIRVLVRNAEFLERWRTGLARLLRPAQALRRSVSRNTVMGSRRNIGKHYDLSNEFFAQFLDKEMMYSSALFENGQEDLDTAAVAKLDRICQKLRLGPQDHVIEIGTGWGGFAIHAARNYGCRVTTTTISAEQFRHARLRVEEAGLCDRIAVLDRDYRELQGSYDALVSIEMIEAVGAEYIDTFFARCSDLLKADGRMLIQAITIGDEEFERAARSMDFIQAYIFPGSCLPSLRRMREAVREVTDLRLNDVFDLTSSYAKTLRAWRERFKENLPRMKHLGFDERFQRMWDFYLCYCEGGFMESRIGVVQLEYAKPRHVQLGLLQKVAHAR